MPGGWAGSTRTHRLPPGWQALCRAVSTRDGGQCTWMEYGHRCTAAGTEVDHVRPGDDHTMGNLRLLCKAHHARKSSREGTAARWRMRERRDAEPHPGMTQ